jgi:hypothetical protein
MVTYGTHLVSSRKPRGDPAENPAEHPGGTWRPTGPQGPMYSTNRYYASHVLLARTQARQ